MVLVLLGMVVFSVLSAQNLSAYVKENLTVTMVLSQDMSNPEAKALTNQLRKLPYINRVEYISKEQVLKEQNIEIVANYVGELLTVQEQAGFQMFMARMDDELLRLWNAPCKTPYLTK